MSEREHQEKRPEVMTEDTEFVPFPIPKDVFYDRVENVKWFLDCTYHRLYYLNQPDQQRSRELSLAITNLQQAGFWLDVHINVRKGPGGSPPPSTESDTTS
jgi:hypothetical protein